MAINNRHDFHAFSAFRCPNLCPATLGHHERRVDEAFFFIQRTSVAKLVSNIRQQPPQNLVAAPSLKAPMYRFVVGIALRQHMPLRTCVEKPQDRFKNVTCRDRLASLVRLGKCNENFSILWRAQPAANKFAWISFDHLGRRKCAWPSANTPVPIALSHLLSLGARNILTPCRRGAVSRSLN